MASGTRKQYELLFTLKAAMGSNFNSSFSGAMKITKSLQDELSRINSVSGKIEGFKRNTEALAKNKSKMAELSKEQQELQKKMSETEKPSESLRKKFERNQRQIEKVNTRIREQEGSLSNLQRELEEAGVDTNNLGEANNELARSYENARKFQEDYARISAAQEDNRAAISQAKGDLLKTVNIAKTVGMALYNGPVKAAAEFELQMANVEAISGATKDEMVLLSAKAKQMGLDTKYTAVESGKALEYMAMAGWKSDEMLNGLDGIMTLAAASGEDLALVSDIVTDSLTAFKLKAGDSAHFADILAAAAGNSNTNVSLLGESFKDAAPLAGALGFSAEDTSFALGLMANAGIKGSKSGNALKSGLVNLVKPTRQMAATMDEYGISLQSNAETVEEYEKELLEAALAEKQATNGKAKLTVAEKKVLHTRALSRGENMSLMDSIIQIRESMNGLSEAEKANAAAAIFGKEAVSGWLAVINASDEDFAKLAGAITNCNGEAERMKDIKLDTLKGDADLLKSAYDGLSMSVGEALTPSVREAMQWITELLVKSANWAKANPELLKRLAKLAAGFAALKTGGLVAKLGFLEIKGGVLAAQKIIRLFRSDVTVAGADGVRSVSSMSKAVTLLKASFAFLSSPVGIAVGAIAALTAGAYLFVKAKEKARKETINFADGLKEAGKKLDDVNSKSKNTKGLIDEYRNLEDVIKDNSSAADDVVRAKERMRDIEKELIDQNPEVLSRYDQENGKISKNLDLLEKKIDRELEVAKYQYKEEFHKAKEKLPDAIKEYQKLNGKTGEYKEQLDTAIEMRRGLYDLKSDWNSFLKRNPNEDERLEYLEKSKKKVEELVQSFGFELGKTDVNLGWDWSKFSEYDEHSVLLTLDDLFTAYDKKASNLTNRFTKTNEEISTIIQNTKEYYDTGVKLVEMELGESFEEAIKRLATMKDELAGLEEKGDGGGERAAELRNEIELLSPKVEDAAIEIDKLRQNVEDVPEVITIDVGEAVEGIDTLSDKIKKLPSKVTIPIETIETIKTNVMAGAIAGATATIRGYASGGIIMKPTLATFAEDGPEAAIPIDKSTNSKALWLKTGQLLGMNISNNSTQMSSNVNPTAFNSLPKLEPVSVEAVQNAGTSISIQYNPVIYVDGDSPEDLETKLKQNNESLLDMFKDYLRNERENERRMRYV